jgi:S-phase kinase-associated protein 1
MSHVPLLSSDEIPFSVPRAVANCSGLLHSILEDQVEVTEPIPLLSIEGSILQKVLEFCEQYVVEPMPTIEKPIRSGDFKDIVTPWYDEYANMHHSTLFKVVEAANYMDIKPLLDLACAKIAHTIKDRTVEEIRTAYDLPNDFTPEEETALQEELRWCEEQ